MASPATTARWTRRAAVGVLVFAATSLVPAGSSRGTGLRRLTAFRVQRRDSLRSVDFSTPGHPGELSWSSSGRWLLVAKSIETATLRGRTLAKTTTARALMADRRLRPTALGLAAVQHLRVTTAHQTDC
jgi:hypothetical protein